MPTAPLVRKTLDEVPDLMTAAELSAVSGLTTNTLAIYRMQGQNKGPRFCKLGGWQVRYDKEDVRAWIEASKCLNTSQHPRQRTRDTRHLHSAAQPVGASK